EINPFYTQALEILSQTDINIYRTFQVERMGETIVLNTEWVLYTFNIADERTREYFINELQKALANSEAPEEYMQKMATLALKASA
ncbi:MAG: hypothetical protein IE878_02850, partial [Epsilonproteobacteria bacterium]|nr:hypothetical protein [Campylobacterota bacterium]